MLPHRYAMLQTQDMTSHLDTVYRHRDELSLCYCHWCGMSHSNTQLPILMSCIRPDQEILPRPSPHTSQSSTLWCWYHGYGGSQSVESIPYQCTQGPGVCQSIKPYARPQMFLLYNMRFYRYPWSLSVSILF